MKESGGIKDVIIWESCLEFIEQKYYDFDEFIFISNDGDFIEFADTPRLHEHLIQGFDSRKIRNERVWVLNTIADLIKKVIIPRLPTIKIPMLQDGNFINNTLTSNQKIIRSKIKDALENLTLSTMEFEILSLTKMNDVYISEEATFLNNKGYLYASAVYKPVTSYIQDEFNKKPQHPLAKIQVMEVISPGLSIVRETLAAEIHLEIVFDPDSFAIEQTNVMDEVNLYVLF